MHHEFDARGIKERVLEAQLASRFRGECEDQISVMTCAFVGVTALRENGVVPTQRGGVAPTSPPRVAAAI